jgi:hypothetical protein
MVFGIEIRDLNLEKLWVKTFRTISGGLEFGMACHAPIVVWWEKTPSLEKLQETKDKRSYFSSCSTWGLISFELPQQATHGSFDNQYRMHHPAATWLWNFQMWAAPKSYQQGHSPYNVVIKIWLSNAQMWEKARTCRKSLSKALVGTRLVYILFVTSGCHISWRGYSAKVNCVAFGLKEEWASYWNWPEFEKDSFYV